MDDIAIALRKRNKLLWRNKSQFRILKPHQRFQGHNLPFLQGIYRLIVDQKPLLPDRPRHGNLHFSAAAVLCDHVRVRLHNDLRAGGSRIFKQKLPHSVIFRHRLKVRRIVLHHHLHIQRNAVLLHHPVTFKPLLYLTF